MIFGSLIVGAPGWVVPAVLLGGVAAVVVLLSYWRSPAPPSVRLLASILKLIGIAALVLCLIEPLLSDKRPREGANMFVLLTDDSQSLNMRNSGDRRSRASHLRELLAEDAAWQIRLRQDFDVRWYAFDQRLRGVRNAAELTFSGTDSAVNAALSTLSRRFHQRPVSGILLFSDGITTDRLEQLLADTTLPPVFPVLLSDDEKVKDLRIANISVNQTNFEAAPVTIVAEIECQGYDGASLVAQLCDESGEVLRTASFVGASSGSSPTVRFEYRPEASGVLFYELRVFPAGDEEAFEKGKTQEVTLVNNRKLVTVNRGQGPYRVLYVCGRPNWEFKFLRRSIQEDQEVQLVGLLRIAKREAKFDFRGYLSEDTNPLYRGFGNQGDEQAEQYDEPVLLRLGTRDELELRNGFPRVADELFAYDAVILDDVEAAFFTRDQLSLLQQFVSHRGGGFMMLGGQESFDAGGYRHTPIAEMLPVYVDRAELGAADDRYRLVVTREGMLQPWTRLRATEQAERQRVNAMPPFHILNLIDSIKPGATVLSYARASSGEEFPALVTQRFGKGRTLSLAVGDLWRWGMRREKDQPRELEKAWRQTVRWLVADVPKRVDVQVRPVANEPSGTLDVTITARDAFYEPLDNAAASVNVQGPDGAIITLSAQPSETEAGVYQARYVPAKPGSYRASVQVNAADGSDVGSGLAGWTADPAHAEFETLSPRRDMFQQLADKTGGAMVAPAKLASFVADLPNRKNVITEPWVYPFWHQWWVFSLAVSCLVAEWGLRRWKGLA